MSAEDFQDFTQFEKDGWSDPMIAQAYAADFAQAAQYSVPVMLDRAEVVAGTKVLDLCCGHGILAEAAVARGAEVTGVDFSQAMLEMAQARVTGATFLQGDAMALDLADASYDAVVVGFGIPHVPDATQVFAEAARVLKPKGQFAYSAWQDAEGAMRDVFQAIAGHGAPGIALPAGPGAHDFADLNRATDALLAAGFEDVGYDTVDSVWQVQDPMDALRFFKEGTVRGSALLNSQPAEAMAAIRDALRKAIITQYGAGPKWVLPMPSAVISARVR